MNPIVSIVNPSERKKNIRHSGTYQENRHPLPQWAREIELRPGLKMTITDCTHYISCLPKTRGISEFCANRKADPDGACKTAFGRGTYEYQGSLMGCGI